MKTPGNGRSKAVLVFFVCLVIVLLAEFTAHQVMTGFGKVEVSNVWIENQNGLMIRGKLYVPENASAENPAPGVVYLHGYQNNRETSDPYGIELSRRGFVVLNLDTLGRGNSENQFSEEEKGFDSTYGAHSAFQYLCDLPMVDSTRCGMGGHSLGGEMVYTEALVNSQVKAVIFSGFAYKIDASTSNPANMLMIFGKYDEYRNRMTGTSDFSAEWMLSDATRAVFPLNNPSFETTYGSFAEGTARQVHRTETTHVGECFDSQAIGKALSWFEDALENSSPLASDDQIWRIKEICSFIALIVAIISLIPLALILLSFKPFSKLAGKPGEDYICTSHDFKKASFINGLLEWLYLPCILIIFGLHVYVVPIDGVFPMMMVNGVVFWFLVINLIGFLVFRKWLKNKQTKHPEITGKELGITIDYPKIGLSLALACLLFIYIYLLEAGLERFLLIDFRYKFPYASDLTPFRFLMFLEYAVLFFLGYWQLNVFLQGQIRPRVQKNWFKTCLFHSIRSLLVVIIPLLLLMAVQYLPLYLMGTIPFVGPGGALVGFMINLEHMCVILGLMIPLATFLYHFTGNIYTGAFINALIVAWMFTSSSVIAPLPI